MISHVCLFAVIVFIYGGLSDQLPSQCFNYQAVPVDRDRSRFKNISDPNSTPCDNMADGSYTFQTGEISTSCVPVNHCGTVSTIWMRDPIPDVGTSSYNEFCVNHRSSSHGDPCCLFSFRVNVTNCDGFLVYDFRSDDVLCPSGYCTDTVTTCPPGQSSTTGFAPCQDSYPVMKAPPTLEEPVLSANGEDFSQTCVIHYNGSFAEFKVTWLFDGKEYKTRILTNGTTQDSLNSDDWIGHVGQKLRCQVTSYLQYSSNASHSPTLDSNSYFGGFVVPSKPITVGEDRQREITLVSTLPVVCKNASWYTCQHDMMISIQGVNPTGLMVSGGCSLEMKPEYWDSSLHHMELNLTFTMGVDNMLHPPADYLVHFNVSHPMWNSYQIPDLQVTTHDKPFHICLAIGDPHIIGVTLGSTALLFPGDYLLYKADSSYGNILQVQARLWSPHHQGSSICAVALQYNEALIMVDMCTTRVDKTAPVITQGEVTPDDLRVYRCGAEYKILTGDGVHVTIHLHEHHMDLKLDLPPSYPTHVEGACNISAGHPPEPYLTLKHAQAWNLQPNESFFLDGGLDFYRVQPRPAPTARRFCTCRSASTCDPFGRFVDPLCTMAGQHLKCESHCEMVTPHAVNPEHGAFTVEDPREYGKLKLNWPHSITNITTINSTCHSKIAHNLPNVCKSNALFIGIFTWICLEDYKASGGFTFADSAVLGAIWGCEFIEFSPLKNYHQAPDGSYYLKHNLALAYCPDHCNGNGNCVGGRCACSPGYKGEDCSIRADTPPQILGIKGGEECVMSSGHCLYPILITRNVENSDKLIAKIVVFETPLDRAIPANVTMLLEAKYESKYSVYLPVSRVFEQLHERTAVGLLISLSNDGKLFSKPTFYGIYDDKCVYCTFRYGCLQKESSCHIDGQCFVNGETNPTNASEVCNPDIGLVRWSARTLPNPSSLISTSSTLVQSATSQSATSAISSQPTQSTMSSTPISSTAKSNQLTTENIVVIG